MTKKELLSLEDHARTDRDAFCKYVDAVMTKYSIDPRDVSHQFNCSLPSVKRWREGTNAPVPTFRSLVIDFLAHYVHGTKA